MTKEYRTFKIQISCGRGYTLVARDVEDTIERWKKMVNDQELDCIKEDCQIQEIKESNYFTLVDELPNAI